MLRTEPRPAASAWSASIAWRRKCTTPSGDTQDRTHDRHVEAREWTAISGHRWLNIVYGIVCHQGRDECWAMPRGRVQRPGGNAGQYRPYLSEHARGAALVVLSSQLRAVLDAILYRLRGVHQFLMAAERSALKERADRSVPFIERNNDVGWTAWAFVRIGDGVLAPTEAARMILEPFTGALETFFNGEPRTFVGASGESRKQEHS